MKGSKGKILVVDDERSMREVLEIFLKGEGYDVTVADGGRSGIEAAKKDIFDLVITDLKMPRVGGVEVLRNVKSMHPDTVVVIITAFGSTESAIEAMKLGAYDYIQKPFKTDDIRLAVKNALEKRKLQKDVLILKEQLKFPHLENIIGKSQAMVEMFFLIPKVAGSDANVLISGESGSGKELVSKAIHNLSPRKDNAFIAINCAAIPENLLESELFGFMKGAFTGAVSNKQGLFELADDGTLFLDEIGEMSTALQAKLLRVIEDGTFRRLGGTTDIKVDVRIVTATNKDIKSVIEQGLFREDLYFRLNVLSVKVPSLRERRDDIPLLTGFFLKKHSGNKKQMSPEAMEALTDYPWKGNVRELENIVERVSLLSEGDIIEVSDLPEEIRMTSEAEPAELPAGGVNFEKLIEDIEKGYLIKALEKTNGVKTEAARLLNLSFRSFRHRLKKYGIEKKTITD
ncbi:MAG TPA: sigma-54-dependent Fis family transcriptional regulator [Nitrospirae bacterium]|nr:transcriptional regulatory protein ZraR [bacterium BMS3Abin10]GBE39974.1 transcriptional regulatory protein ZraR [bacterium BMS3Bbin08]HDH50434.1 sigma-54-dependent Fis family transcriptional regulator [Nitrospirota bacterium]HDK16322.1 sigma-54-dependent Fis family transcriptional regulator [Nitrospirota bacterium]HDK82133.1 sigma-54-dependent Fis family transcriptional regulator [Nitrospirota bacterium]